jgi:hypothetical protein
VSAISLLSSIGAGAGVTYSQAAYVAPGVSGLAGIGPAAATIGTFTDVAVSTIVRAD